MFQTNVTGLEIERRLIDCYTFKKWNAFSHILLFCSQKLNQYEPASVSISVILGLLGYLSITKPSLYITFICAFMVAMETV